MIVEPANYSPLVRERLGLSRATMARLARLPNNELRIATGIERNNHFCVAWRKICIAQAVNEHCRDITIAERPFRRRLGKVYTILPTRVEDSNRHCGAKNCSTNPGARMKLLSEPVESCFFEICKRALRDDGAESRLRFEGLQQLRGAHGFSQPINATW